MEECLVSLSITNNAKKCEVVSIHPYSEKYSGIHSGKNQNINPVLSSHAPIQGHIFVPSKILFGMILTLWIRR